jgi:hypothetical protein
VRKRRSQRGDRYAALNKARRDAGLAALGVRELNKFNAAELDREIRLARSRAGRDGGSGLFKE